MKLNFLLFLLIALSLKQVHGINWQSGSAGVTWAFDCDFEGNDLSFANIPGEKCGEMCIQTSGCTHFAWNDYLGGTCWMKKNPVSLNDAVSSNQKGIVCGMIPSGGSGGSSRIFFLFEFFFNLNEI